MMMLWYGGHWAFWQAGLMWVGMLVFWGLLFWAIYSLIANVTRRPSNHDEGTARHILDQRLARGEIDTTEYQRLRDLIDTGDHESSGTRSMR